MQKAKRPAPWPPPPARPVPLPISLVEIEIDGKVHPLAFTFGSFTVVTRELSRLGLEVNFRTAAGIEDAFNDPRIEVLAILLQGAILGGGGDVDLEPLQAALAGLPLYQVPIIGAKVSEALIASMTPPKSGERKNEDADAAKR